MDGYYRSRLLFAGYGSLIMGVVLMISSIIFLIIPGIVTSAGLMPAGILFLRATHHEGRRAAGLVVVGVLIAAAAMYLAQFLPKPHGNFPE